MEYTDVIIIGASFSGLTLAHHLPGNLDVVVIDRKTRLNDGVESTGLITTATHNELKSFTDVERFEPNDVTSICVVAPDYKKHFFSSTAEPWMYTTDTPELLKHMAETVPAHVDIRLGSGLVSYIIEDGVEYPVHVTYLHNGEKKELRAKFLVGTDGSKSTVARLHHRLSQNEKFLAGHEKVFYGDIHLGDRPEQSVYHFWFGEFSLGYGGWLSPTIIDGKNAFRVGLAKLHGQERKGIREVSRFIEILQEKKIITIDPEHPESVYGFGHLIPIGGVLERITDQHVMLLGDAAGLCGAFAADGIKGAVLSGKIAASMIPEYLSGDEGVLEEYRDRIEGCGGMMSYYRRQVLYRRVWEMMKSDRSFFALYDIVERQKEQFLNQYCDNKDRGKSLARVVLRPKNTWALLLFSWSIFMDMFR